jgi:hypothetical protein
MSASPVIDEQRGRAHRDASRATAMMNIDLVLTREQRGDRAIRFHAMTLRGVTFTRFLLRIASMDVRNRLRDARYLPDRALLFN